MRTITVKMPEELLREMDALIERGLFTNRSELLRYAIRELLMKELWNKHRGASG